MQDSDEKILKKYDTGPIEPSHLSLWYGIDEDRELDELIAFLVSDFMHHEAMSQRQFLLQVEKHHDILKKYPQLKELIKFLNLFAYYRGHTLYGYREYAIERPKELKDIHNYQGFNSDEENMYSDNVKLCEEHNALLDELIELEKQLSKLDKSNPAFDKKYPYTKKVSDLKSPNPKLDFIYPKAFEGLNLNEIDNLIKSLVDENTKLRRRFNKLNQKYENLKSKVK